MIWVNTEYCIQCELCGDVATFEDQRHVSTVEIGIRFREMGWSVGSSRHLCPEHRRGADPNNPTPNSPLQERG